MKEAYVKGMEWTRTFVSGPVDPRWNKYKFYCQICKANISIYSKGARENLRHYSTEKHLRNDQRWRYEYLCKVDPVTKARYPHVRGKDGKLLSPYQLALELSKFKDVELLDIGEKLPFMTNSCQQQTTCPPVQRIGHEIKLPCWDGSFPGMATLCYFVTSGETLE